MQVDRCVFAGEYEGQYFTTLCFWGRVCGCHCIVWWCGWICHMDQFQVLNASKILSMINSILWPWTLGHPIWRTNGNSFTIEYSNQVGYWERLNAALLSHKKELKGVLADIQHLESIQCGAVQLWGLPCMSCLIKNGKTSNNCFNFLFMPLLGVTHHQDFCLTCLLYETTDCWREMKSW